MLAPSAATPPPAVQTASSGFWEQFFTSAGFAGAMAVVAASIAAIVAWRQYRGNQRENTTERWWSTLTWVYDRAIVEKGSKEPLPQAVTMEMLTGLFKLARKDRKDPLRGDTISVVLKMFEPPTPPGSEDGTADVAADEKPAVSAQEYSSDDEREAAILRVNLREELTKAGYGLARDPARLYAESFLVIRLMVGFLGILLPFIFIVGEALFLKGGVHVRGSLSAYYYTPMRDIFVGGLCALAFLLSIYKVGELTGWDFWLTLVAGQAALGIVFFPTLRPGLPPGAPPCGAVPIPPGCTPVQQALGEATTSAIHFVFALIFFICLAAVSFLFASRDRKIKQGLPMAQIQVLCGMTILTAVVWATVGGLLRINIWELTPVYTAEVVAFWAFGCSWLLKGYWLKQTGTLADILRS